MKLADFDFELPDRLIATRPARPRSSARMLVATPERITDAHVRDLPGFLRAGDRLVLNDTQVIPARLSGVRRRGAATAKVDVTLLEPQSDSTWMALVKPLRKVSDGEEIVFSETFSAILQSRSDGQARLKFNLDAEDFDVALDASGAMPLPPYIAARRPADERDRSDYQTIFAEHPGAVAAPTASLHFDDALMAGLKAQRVETSRVTLHVGAGTFLPVKVEDVSQHRMHAERGQVTSKAAAEIAATQAAGGRIIPVGTTALRLLETAAQETGAVGPWEGATDIFITPGFRFRAADALMTNFHLPKSTLMMLVAAFMGPSRIHEIYAHAIRENYRFFSYGDASLLLPQSGSRQD